MLQCACVRQRTPPILMSQLFIPLGFHVHDHILSVDGSVFTHFRAHLLHVLPIYHVTLSQLHVHMHDFLYLLFSPRALHNLYSLLVFINFLCLRVFCRCCGTPMHLAPWKDFQAPYLGISDSEEIHFPKVLCWGCSPRWRPGQNYDPTRTMEALWVTLFYGSWKGNKKGPKAQCETRQEAGSRKAQKENCPNLEDTPNES